MHKFNPVIVCNNPGKQKRGSGTARRLVNTALFGLYKPEFYTHVVIWRDEKTDHYSQCCVLVFKIIKSKRLTKPEANPTINTSKEAAAEQ